jgi:hypothetical protein
VTCTQVTNATYYIDPATRTAVLCTEGSEKIDNCATCVYGRYIGAATATMRCLSAVCGAPSLRAVVLLPTRVFSSVMGLSRVHM